jgi:NAD kinase
MIDPRTIVTAYTGSLGGSIIGMLISIFTLVNIEHLFLVLMSSIVGGSASLLIREIGPDGIKWIKAKLKKK